MKNISKPNLVSLLRHKRRFHWHLRAEAVLIMAEEGLSAAIWAPEDSPSCCPAVSMVAYRGQVVKAKLLDTSEAPKSQDPGAKFVLML